MFSYSTNAWEDKSALYDFKVNLELLARVGLLVSVFDLRKDKLKEYSPALFVRVLSGCVSSLSKITNESDAGVPSERIIFP